MLPARLPFRRLVAAALVVALAAPGAALAAEDQSAPATAGNGRVRAKLVGSNGKTPVAGAILKVHHLDNGKIYASGPSSKSGECAVKGVPYGYVDFAVETKEGVFVDSQAVNVPPEGSVKVTFALTKFTDRAPALWTDRTPRQVPGTTTAAAGIAELETRTGARAFWTSPGGLALIGGATALMIMAVSNRHGSSTTTPSTTTP